jgi:hypothetical protein
MNLPWKKCRILDCREPDRQQATSSAAVNLVVILAVAGGDIISRRNLSVPTTQL